MTYNPIQKAYDLMVGFVHERKTTDLEQVIGYLGEALDDQTDSSFENTTATNVMDTEYSYEIKKGIHEVMISADSEPTIKDSGDRTKFESGAVRDMRTGKGRCDLMPLEVVRDLLNDDIIGYIANFMQDYDTSELYECLHTFAHVYGSGDKETMLLDVAKHYEEGALKYGESNWQRGIPTWCYIDSAIRHYLKWLRDDNDEPHDRAFVWNLMCCIWEVDYREKERNQK